MIGFALLTVLVNFVLMLVKILTGILGNSYALIADGIESASDIVVSLITWTGVQISLLPPDDKHPFGHGKIESLAGIFSGGALIIAGLIISNQSIKEIVTPHHSPEWFTLPVLLVVVIIKELLARRISHMADEIGSRALEGDAWHHRSDALTSASAAIGISIALVGGQEYAAADDWGALFACCLIFFNGGRIVARSFHENIDGRVDIKVTETLLHEAATISGVCHIEQCKARKCGCSFFAELHVQVDPQCNVGEGHRIGHQVKDHLLLIMPSLQDVSIHLEPYKE